MRLLVTRPEPDAGRTARALAERGHEVVVAPLTEIRPIRADIPDIPLQAVLLTSANAARVVAGRSEMGRLAGLPVFAVGAASAEAAWAAGFGEVHVADGDAGALAALARRSLTPADGALLHLAARHLAADLARLLEPDGFAVHRSVVYEAAAAPELPRAARMALAQGRLDAALVYSPRTARLLVQLTADAGLSDRLSRLRVYCLSPAVAAPFEAAGVRDVVVAAMPEEAAMLAALSAPGLATAKAKRV